MSSKSEAKEILSKLAEKGKNMTAAEIKEQKFSFIKGTIGSKVTVSDSEIRKSIDKFTGSSS